MGIGSRYVKRLGFYFCVCQMTISSEITFFNGCGFNVSGHFDGHGLIPIIFFHYRFKNQS